MIINLNSYKKRFIVKNILMICFKRTLLSETESDTCIMLPVTDRLNDLTMHELRALEMVLNGALCVDPNARLTPEYALKLLDDSRCAE
jgi:hypothetical protein